MLAVPDKVSIPAPTPCPSFSLEFPTIAEFLMIMLPVKLLSPIRLLLLIVLFSIISVPQLKMPAPDMFKTALWRKVRVTGMGHVIPF